MQSEKKVVDDLAKVVNGIAGTLAGMGREVESSLRERTRDWVGGADSIGRDEFEAVKAMAIAARDENDALKARLSALEAQLSVTSAAARPAAKTKPPRA